MTIAARCAPVFLLVMAFVLTGCAGNNTKSNVVAPGAAESAKTRALETGTALIQNEPPIEAINIYMDGFHFYSGDMKHQMEAHHYCSIVNEDVTQCIIFDGNTRQAKLMGVEYIVSRNTYQTLLPEEQALWHSHAYEVTSGELISPGVPKAAEHAFMEKMASTYGKTWHTWNTDLNLTLPIGHPMLMMGFTADGQIHDDMVASRDQRFGTSTADNKKDRAEIKAPPVLPTADAWQKGKAPQLSLSTK